MKQAQVGQTVSENEATTLDRAVGHVRQALADRVAGICVFGSFADGTNRPDSDLDLAVLPREALDPVDLWDLAQQSAAQAHRDVDLIDLWRASTVLQHQIVVTGKWVFVADEAACALFEASTLTRYCHLNDERREILEEVESRSHDTGVRDG